MRQNCPLPSAWSAFGGWRAAAHQPPKVAAVSSRAAQRATAAGNGRRAGHRGCSSPSSGCPAAGAGPPPLRSPSTSASVLNRDSRRGRSARRLVLPQSAVPENLLDDVGLMRLDEGDDAHRRTTLGTADWVRCVNLFDQRGPAFASLACRGRAGGNPRSGTRRRLPFIRVWLKGQRRKYWIGRCTPSWSPASSRTLWSTLNVEWSRMLS